jgi:hypothetical protein
MILGKRRDRNCQNQCPEMLLVRVWKGVEEWAFGWNTKKKKKKKKKKGNLDSVDYTQYFHGLESGAA